MRHLLLLLLGCIPMLASAQTLTETQKQEALQCATKFCDLLTRFSNGERTLTSQINALCSGADCSAYDDIKTNKETTLRNYLMAIQQKYPKSLQMDIASPSLSNSRIYVEKEYEELYYWGKTENNDASVLSAVQELKVKKILNTYIVFDIVQSMTSLQKKASKKLIYDTNSHKITAFITNDGAFMNYLNANLTFSNKEYRKAMELYNLAAQNDRTAFKKKCYEQAMECAWLIADYDLAADYADKAGVFLGKAEFKTISYIESRQYDLAYPYVLEIERGIVNVQDKYAKANLYNLLGEYYAATPTNHDGKKSLNYLKKADELGHMLSGYLIWWFGTYDDAIDLSSLTKEEWLGYLMKSAQRGYPSSFFIAATIEEYEYKNMAAAVKWYEKSAKEAGNPLGMACYGKYLLSMGNMEQGKAWIKKSLEGRTLEDYLDDYEKTIGVPAWPEKRADIEVLLNKYNTNSYSNHNTQMYAYSTSASTSSSSYTSSNNYSYRRRHDKLNEKKDDYCVGFSAGYVQKQWVYDFDDSKEKVDIFGEDKYTNGLQFGIRVDPQFGYGFGINTGLFYEYYFDKSDDMYDDGVEYHFTAEEHCLYMPIHLKYSLNFSKWFQLAFYGGIGLDYGLSGKIYLRCEGETYDSISLYDADYDIKHFNTSLEYGMAVRSSRFQLNLTMSQGLVNMTSSDEYKVKQSKLMSISVSVYF